MKQIQNLQACKLVFRSQWQQKHFLTLSPYEQYSYSASNQQLSKVDGKGISLGSDSTYFPSQWSLNYLSVHARAQEYQ